jgi:hypothetical protein
MKYENVFFTMADRNLTFEDFPVECKTESAANSLAEKLSSIDSIVYHVVKVISSEAPWLVIQHEDTVFSNETKTGSWLEGKKLDL